MATTSAQKSSKQALFRSSLVGVLLYSVVLGFFNDYTDILDTGTYSTTFALAVVMQVLTYATFKVKDRVVALAKAKGGSKERALIVLGVWLVMFLSKFIFLAVIGVVFRDSVYISGFIGLLIMIITMTVLDVCVSKIDTRLEGQTNSTE